MNASYRETIKGLIQIVWADGNVDDRERIILGQMLSELGLSAKDLTEVGKMMQEAPELPNLDEILKQPQADKDDLMRVLLALSMSRGTLNAPELRYIQSVAHRLGITEERLDELKAEVRKLPEQKGK
jgi:DnaJ-domain-containing protein 1